MLTVVVWFVLFVVAVLAITAASVTLLALGTGLARLFPVSPFEATIVATVVAFGIIVVMVTRVPGEGSAEIEEDEEEEGPEIILHAAPLVRPRGGRKRRH